MVEELPQQADAPSVADGRPNTDPAVGPNAEDVGEGMRGGNGVHASPLLPTGQAHLGSQNKICHLKVSFSHSCLL